jgi:hypothetical protein
MLIAMVMLGCWLGLLLLARRQFFHIALLGFPGVVMHELAHLLVGMVLLAKPTSLNLWPRRVGNQWQFGSVGFTGLNLFNAAPVAYAPLLLLGAAWFSFHHWMLPQVTHADYAMALLWSYLIACATLYSLPSLTDIRVGGWSTLFWTVLASVSVWLYWGH